jgi:hypothetical protein
VKYEANLLRRCTLAKQHRKGRFHKAHNFTRGDGIGSRQIKIVYPGRVAVCATNGAIANETLNVGHQVAPDRHCGIKFGSRYFDQSGLW